MPGSTPATSQLDWLSSTTAMIVLSWSKATRDLLKSFSWGIGALRQLFASDDGAISFAACPIPSHRGRERDSNPRSPPQKGYAYRNSPVQFGNSPSESKTSSFGTGTAGPFPPCQLRTCNRLGIDPVQRVGTDIGRSDKT